MFNNLVEIITKQDKIKIERSTLNTEVNYNENDLVIKNFPKYSEIFDILLLKQYQKRAVNLSDFPEFGRRIGCHLTCTFDKNTKKSHEKKFVHHSCPNESPFSGPTKELGSLQTNELNRLISDTQSDVSCKSAIRYVSVRDTFRLDIFRNRKSSCHSNLVVYELPMFQQIKKELCWNYDIGYSGYNPMQEHKLFISELIKNSVLTHNLQKSSLSILPICFCGNYFVEPLFKVGSLILQSSYIGKEHLSNYQALIKNYAWDQFRPELALNIAMNHMENDSNFLEAYQILTEYISSKPYRENPYFNIMYGQLEYCMWKKASNDTKKASSLIKYEWDDEECDSESTESISSQFHRQRALLHLSLVEDRLGTWDQILPKYIELNKDNVITVLEKHLKNNPDNPISYWYLATVLKDIESGELWDVLKLFSSVDVTSDLVKELIVHYQKLEKHKEVFNLVVERLDHKFCINSSFDWEMLHWVVLRRKDIVSDYANSNPRWISYHFQYPWNHLNEDALNLDVLKPIVQLKMLIADALQIGNDWLSLYNDHQRETHFYVKNVSGPCLVSVSLKCSSKEKSFNDLDISTPEITDCSESSECLSPYKIKKHRKRAVKRQYNYKSVKNPVLTINESESDSEMFRNASNRISNDEHTKSISDSLDKKQTGFLLGVKPKYIGIQKIDTVHKKTTLSGRKRKLHSEIPQKIHVSNKEVFENDYISENMNLTFDDPVTPYKRMKLSSDKPTPHMKSSSGNESMNNITTRQQQTTDSISNRRESVSSLSDSSNSSWNSDQEIYQIKMSVMKNIQKSTKRFTSEINKLNNKSDSSESSWDSDKELQKIQTTRAKKTKIKMSVMKNNRKSTKRFTAEVIKSNNKSDSSESSWDSDKELKKIQTTRAKNTKISINDSKKSNDKTFLTPLRNSSWEKKICKELNFSNFSQ